MAPLTFLLTSDVLGALQLSTDPIGWDSLRELIERDTNYHGITLTVSSELTFVKAGAAYLRTVYEGGTDANGVAVPAQGVNGLVALTVYEQNPNEFRQEEIYRGVVNLLTYSSTEAGVTCEFKETGFTTALLSRDQTEIDLLGGESLSGNALPTYAPVVAQLHSQQTLQRFESRQTTPDNNPQEGTGSDLISGSNEQLLYFGMPVLLNELSIDAFPTGPEIGEIGGPTNIAFYTAKASGVHMVELLLNTTVRVRQIADNYFDKVDIKYQFRKNNEPAIDLIAPFYATGVGGGDQRYRLNVSARVLPAIDMQVGDKLYLYGDVYVHDFRSGLIPVISPTYTLAISCAMGEGSYLKVSAPTTTKETACYGLLAHEALQRACEACTDQRDAFYSEYFGRPDCRTPYAATGPGALRMVTSGFQLRGFPLPSDVAGIGALTDERKTITAALRTLFTGFDATDCLGMGVETRDGRPVVRIEERGHFYQPTDTLQLGAVKGLKKGPYAEWLYNQVQVGYTHWQSGAPNGLDEFNAKRTYATPLTVQKKTYTIVSGLNAAGYLIEQARRDPYNQGGTKEGQADAEPFVICLVRNPDGTYRSEQLEGYVAGGMGGILSPATAYNLRLSPGRMLRRHGPWIRAGLWAETDKRLLSTATEGNGHLVSQQVGEAAPLDEGPDVAIADLLPPVALAETYEFTARLRRGQMLALTKNPYGRVSFLDGNGTRKAGYLLRAERTPKTGETAFTLLRAAL